MSICPAPKQFQKLFDDQRRKIIMPSGRTSGKTTTVEIAAVLFCISNRRNNIWYCRAEKNDLRKIYESIIATIQAMGQEDKFSKFRQSPFEITAKSGAKIYFSGINGLTESDLNATKGFVPAKRSLKMFIVDEVNETKCEAHITAAETTANKFLIDGSKIVYMYNPPPLKTHYIHAWAEKQFRNGTADKIYTTYKNISKVLKPATLAEIEQMRINDPIFYRYWYLGEVVNLSGMVYPQFKRSKHCVNIYNLLAEGDRITELIIGLDEGTVNDSTCATPLAIMASGKAVVLDLYEYSPTDRANNQEQIGQLSASEQSRRLWQWLVELVMTFPMLNEVPRMWIFESAEGGQILRTQFVQDYGEKTCLVWNKSIWGDVKRVRNMLSEGILLFHIAPNVNTERLVLDIENYIIDEKTNDIKKDQREDSIDSLEYATKLYYDKPIVR